MLDRHLNLLYVKNVTYFVKFLSKVKKIMNETGTAMAFKPALKMALNLLKLPALKRCVNCHDR